MRYGGAPWEAKKMTGFPTAYSCFQDFLSHVKGKSQYPPYDADIDIVYNLINVLSHKYVIYKYILYMRVD